MIIRVLCTGVSQQEREGLGHTICRLFHEYGVYSGEKDENELLLQWNEGAVRLISTRARLRGLVEFPTLIIDLFPPVNWEGVAEEVSKAHPDILVITSGSRDETKFLRGKRLKD